MLFQLTERAENIIRGVDTIKRLQAFSAAVADVLHSLGLSTLAQLQTVTARRGHITVTAPIVLRMSRFIHLGTIVDVRV